jgi:RNase P/RNase MRP subunit POP5
MSKRYLLVKAMCKRPISAQLFEAALISSIRRLFGDFGLARIDPKVVRFDATSLEAVVACNSERAEDLQAAIGLISDTSESTITALTLRVSGTIKGLRRKQRF